jgi:hypothetical protein
MSETPDNRLMWWLLTTLAGVLLLAATAWGAAIHSQLAEIKGSLQTIASSQASFATEVAVLRLRVDQLERERRPLP